MKHLLLSLFITIVTVTFACDRSSVSLVSIAPGPGSTFIITMQMCYGQGVLGVSFGAGGGTRDFAFGIYGPGGAPVFVSAFTPPIATGSFTGESYFAGLFGPQGPPFNTQETLAYIDIGANPNGLGCITRRPSVELLQLNVISIQLQLMLSQIQFEFLA